MFVLFSFVVVMFPFGRLLVLYFSLVVPAICNFFTAYLYLFSEQITDDDLAEETNGRYSAIKLLYLFSSLLTMHVGG